MATPEPYAVLRWACSECGSEPVDETKWLRCERCGLIFAPGCSDYAPLLPTCDDCEEPKDQCTCAPEEFGR
jgi:hypothetical protein